MNRALAPLLGRTTYRRWACLIIGGALLMPYMMAGQVISVVWRPTRDVGDPLLAAQPRIFVAVLPVVALTGLFLPVRAFEIAAARTLLGAAVEPAPAAPRRTWAERRRTAAWFTLHLAVGGVVSGMTLSMAPFAVWLAALPLAGDHLGLAGQGISGGWAAAWGPPGGAAVLVCLIFTAAGAGALLARLAPAFLAPSAADRLVLAEEAARRLAARNRLARELHDSIGHALSVVTVQAAAAGRVLDRDPDAARAALEAVETSARGALEELDHVIGVLREGGGGATRTLDDLPALLDDLPALLDASRPADRPVTRRLGDLSAVPPVISREAYRVVQEALTNAIRYGSGPVEVSAGVRDRILELSVRNGVATGAGGTGGTLRGGRRRAPSRPGHGLAGIRERVTLLGGRVEAGGADGEWRVRVRIPLPGGDRALASDDHPAAPAGPAGTSGERPRGATRAAGEADRA